MENVRPSDVRMYVVVGLFFLCIVSGGAFFALYVFRTNSPLWYATGGMVLVGIPWVVWLILYLYRCIVIYRNRGAIENNAGRVFPKSNTSHRSRSTDKSQSPRSPSQDSPNGKNRQVQIGGVVVLEESNQQDGDDERQDVESPTESKDKKDRESKL